MMPRYLEPPAAPQEQPSVMSEGLLQKLGQGLTFGWRDELSGALQGALTNAFDPNFKSAYGEDASATDLAIDMQRRQEDAYAQANPLAAAAAELAGAVTTGIATGGLAAGAGATGLGAAVGTGMLEGAVYGAGAANEDSRLKGAATGALIGGVAAPVGYGLGKATSRIMGKLKNVAATTSNRASEITKGQKLGYDYTPAQKTGSDTLSLVETGFKRDPATADIILKGAQKNQMVSNRLAAKSIGENASDLGTDTIDSAFTRLSNEFENLGGLKNIAINKGHVKQAQNIKAGFQQQLGKPKAPAFLDDFIEQLQGAQKNGLPADRYQSLHSELGQMLKQYSKDPGKLNTIGQMRDLLNEAVEGSLPSSALPRWQKAREQWGNLQTLMKPGAIKDGNVSEAVVANKLRQQNARSYLSGESSDIADMARFGALSKQGLPSSGTAEGILAQRQNRKLLPDILPRIKANLYMRYPGLFSPENLQGAGMGETAGLISILEQIARESGETGLEPR
jgi:hypothetical protein